MNIYKLNLDICNKLISIPLIPKPVSKTITGRLLLNLPTYIISSEYPFNIGLSKDSRYANIEKLTILSAYDIVKINEITTHLISYLTFLEQEYRNRYNVINTTNNFAKQPGLCYEGYLIPSKIKANVVNIMEASTEAKSIFDNTYIKQNITEDERNKYKRYTVINDRPLSFIAYKNIITIIKTHLSVTIPTPVPKPAPVPTTTPVPALTTVTIPDVGNYDFNIVIFGYNAREKPAGFVIEVLFNDVQVLYRPFCTDINVCKTDLDKKLQEYERTLGTASLEYISTKKMITDNHCVNTLCTIPPKQLILPFNIPLILNKDISNNSLEIRIINNMKTDLNIYLTYKKKSESITVPFKNFPSYKGDNFYYNRNDYNDEYINILTDKMTYYYPAIYRKKANEKLIADNTVATTNIKQQLITNIAAINVDALAVLGINSKNYKEITSYISGNSRIYMFFKSPASYVAQPIDNTDAINDFNKYITFSS